jgi:pimeloyl-ACP methyl ester carboxylesterase
MFTIIDRYLLRRPLPFDDWTIFSRRIDGANPGAPVIFFLPWHTPYWLARRIGLICSAFTACYELAPALVSSEPERSVSALKRVSDDAEALLKSLNIVGSATRIVGYSLGTYPATYLANRLGACLYSIAPADRGDLMIWQSPAARIVRDRAMAKGYCEDDYVQAMKGYNPIDNLGDLGRGSTFVFGASDPFIPPERSQSLVQAVRQNCRDAYILQASGGHVRTLAAGASYLRARLGSPKLHNISALQPSNAC